MSAFINKAKGCWDSRLIHEVMDKEVVVVICGLPLIKLGYEDKFFWGYSKKCLFTIRSTYHLAADRLKKSKWRTVT